MSMRPNWFDYRYEEQLEKVSADKAMEFIAKDKRVLTAVKDALQMHDEHAGESGWGGPTRTQAIRSAVAAVLNAEEGDPILNG